MLVFPTSKQIMRYLYLLIKSPLDFSSSKILAYIIIVIFELTMIKSETAFKDPSTEGSFAWFCFKTWYPFSTLRSMLILSFALGLIFLVIAIAQIGFYSSSFQQQAFYYENGECIQRSNGTNCEVLIQITQTLQPPIYLMYIVENAYINHRKYIDSISPEQLSGKTIDASQAKKECYPFQYNSDLHVNSSYEGKPLDQSLIASPCGFKPALIFNDTFTLFDQKSSKIFINQSGIELNSNEFDSYKNSADSGSTSWINIQNGHFLNWMRSQALITKYKQWGRIQKRMMPGKYNLVVKNNYVIGNMRIRKGVELVMPSALGGKIWFFPIVYLFMGITCIAYGIFLKVKFPGYDELMEQLNMNK